MLLNGHPLPQKTLNGSLLSEEPTAPPRTSECPTCGGLGFVIPADAPANNARAVPCPDGCNLSVAQRRLQSLSGLTAGQRQLSLSVKWHPAIAPAVDVVRTCLTTRPPAGFILLAGSNGCGKTHILASAVNAAVMAGWPAVYTLTADLLDHLRRAYNPGAEVSFDGRLDQVKRAAVLGLDEIDRVNTTAWAEEQLFRLLDARYQAAMRGDVDGRKTLTLCATNKRLAELPPYLVSRFRDTGSHVFELFGAPDARRIRDITGGF